MKCERIVLPDDAILILIRENHSVAILNIPHDLTRREADKIERIIKAHVNIKEKE